MTIEKTRRKILLYTIRERERERIVKKVHGVLVGGRGGGRETKTTGLYRLGFMLQKEATDQYAD